MPSNWPIVITPVPPTPATTMPQGFSASGKAGSGSGDNVNGFGRPPFLSDPSLFLPFPFNCPPSTVMKLGQKPFTQE